MSIFRKKMSQRSTVKSSCLPLPPKKVNIPFQSCKKRQENSLSQNIPPHVSRVSVSGVMKYTWLISDTQDKSFFYVVFNHIMNWNLAWGSKYTLDKICIGFSH